MKIGILTQPLLKNYGGILQAYALQKVLKEMGHEVWLIQRSVHSHSFFLWLKNTIYNVVKYCLGRKKYKWLYRRTEDVLYVSMQLFIDEYIIPKTSKIYSSKGLRQDYMQQHYDAYVVGSDQVWRPKYSPCQTDFFLGFLPMKTSVIRLSYAASFGTDKWEYSDKLSAQCGTLLQYFDGVSVREASAIALCQSKFNYDNVQQVLDPTLLLDREDYEFLAESNLREKNSKKLFCYILDDNLDLEMLRQKLSHQLECDSFTISFTDNNTQIPSPKLWLRAFKDADYVLTDSFHGCVFSIIFNVPFVVLGNEERGQTRFHSLLSLFGLEDRLVCETSFERITSFLRKDINWDIVNQKRFELKGKSFEFLQLILCNEK